MKICPRCQKTYADDSLNFCLEDGSVLNPTSGEQQTVLVNEPRSTQPQPQMPTQPPPQAGMYAPQQYSMQPPKKSSKAWLWVVLILGVVVLVCGGGFAGIVLIGMQAEKDKVESTSVPPRKDPIANKASNSNPTSSPSTSERNDLETVDISEWVKGSSAYGETSFKDGEFFMQSKKKRFYYVLVAPKEYSTDNADTRVTLRNVDDASGTLGYGLIFHSNPTPLQQDYAFLIDTKRQKYRVVHHEPQDEKTVVSWTTSTEINSGSKENTLEVRDLDDKIELYINGTMVTSIKNVYGYTNGVPGLYAGDGVKVAFKNLEIRK